MRAGLSAYRELFSTPGFVQIFAAKAASRLPDIGLAVAALWLTRSYTGSYAWAGAVIAIATIASTIASPLLARWMESSSTLWPLRILSLIAAAGMVGFPAVVWTGAPAEGLFAAALVFGLFDPPMGSLIRSQWTRVLPGELHKAAHVWENVSTELLYVIGPLLASLALLLDLLPQLFLFYALLLFGQALLFRRLPNRSETKTESCSSRRRPWACPALYPVFLAGLLWLFCFDVTVISLAALAEQRDSAAWGGIWVAGLSLGGLVGGVLYGLSSIAGHRLRIDLLLGFGLYGAAGLLFLLPSGLLLAGTVMLGAVSALAFAGIFLWIDRLWKQPDRAEAYQTLISSLALGTFLGTLLGGWAVDHLGPEKTMMYGAVATLLAALLALTAPNS